MVKKNSGGTRTSRFLCHKKEIFFLCTIQRLISYAAGVNKYKVGKTEKVLNTKQNKQTNKQTKKNVVIFTLLLAYAFQIMCVC